MFLSEGKNSLQHYFLNVSKKKQYFILYTKRLKRAFKLRRRVKSRILSRADSYNSKGSYKNRRYSQKGGPKGRESFKKRGKYTSRKNFPRHKKQRFSSRPGKWKRFAKTYNFLLRQTVNNVFITLLSLKGRTLSAITLGREGLRGSRKYTPYGAELAGRRMGLRLYRRRMRYVNIVLKSYPTDLTSAVLKGLLRYNVQIRHIREEISKAHNGLRLRKARRK